MSAPFRPMSCMDSALSSGSLQVFFSVQLLHGAAGLTNIQSSTTALPTSHAHSSSDAVIDQPHFADRRSNMDKHTAFVDLLGQLATKAGRACSAETLATLLTDAMNDIAGAAETRALCVRPPPSLLRLIGAALRLLNVQDVRIDRPEVPLDAAKGAVTAHPHLALATLEAACAEVTDVMRMTQVVEVCILLHVDQEADHSPATGFGYAAVCERLSPPQVLYDEFIRACIGRGCLATLYVRSVQLMMQCRSHEGEERLADTLGTWVQGLCSDTRPLAAATQPERIALLWSQCLRLMSRQLVANLSHDRVVRRLQVRKGDAGEGRKSFRGSPNSPILSWACRR